MAGELIRGSDRYTAEQMVEALALTARYASPTQAARQLGIPKRTVQQWKDRYPETYQRAAEKVAREVEKKIARQAREVAVEAARVEQLGLQRARERLEADTDKQPATTAQRAAVVKGIAVDKALVLEGRPTQIHADATSLAEDLRFLRARAIPDAEVVEESANVVGQLSSSDRSDHCD